MVSQWTDDLVIGIGSRERTRQRVPRWHAWRLWVWRPVVCREARASKDEVEVYIELVYVWVRVQEVKDQLAERTDVRISD